MPPRGWKKADPPRMAGCHPERKHHALGRCKQCWSRDYQERNPKKRFLTVAEAVPAQCCPRRRALTKGPFRGFCEPCVTRIYRLRRRHDGSPYQRRTRGQCSIKGCNDPAYVGHRKRKLLCRKHYDHWRWKNGGLLRRKLAREKRERVKSTT
jgi:hypothetical protein